MPRQFQAPTFLAGQKTKEEALAEPLGQAIGTIPEQYAAYKIRRRQQKLQDLEMQLKERELSSKYGTGVAENVQPGQILSAPPPTAGPEEQLFGFEASMPSFAEESPEQKLRRMGTEGFNAETARLKAEQEKPQSLRSRGQTAKGFNVLFDPNKGAFTISETGEPYDASIHGILRLQGDPSQSNEGIRREGLVNTGLQALADIRSSLTPEVLRDLKVVRNDPTGTYEQISNSQSKTALNNLRTAIENQLYLKTGATATEDETKNAMRKFLASFGDNPQDFESRLSILERDLTSFTRSPKTPTTTVQKPESNTQKPRTVVQNGYTYTLNEATGQYE